MLRADQVAEPSHSSMGSVKIPKLPFAIQRDGVPIDVIVDMSFVGVGADKESVFAFEKTGSEIVADLIGFLRRNFARFERLAYLVNQHIVLFVSANEVAILPFGDQYLGCKSVRVAGIGRGQLAAVGLFGI